MINLPKQSADSAHDLNNISNVCDPQFAFPASSLHHMEKSEKCHAIQTSHLQVIAALK